MSRFSDVVDEIAAIFPTAGDTAFLVGEEHLATNQNHNRIVVWCGDGEIRPPSQASGAKGDDWLWVRYVPTTFAIWASNRDQAENRLHALLVCLEKVFGPSVDSLSNLKERWHMKGVANAGRAVDVSCVIGYVVLASDVNCVQADAEPGAGFAVSTVTGVTLNSTLETTDLPPIIIPPEP